MPNRKTRSATKTKDSRNFHGKKNPLQEKSTNIQLQEDGIASTKKEGQKTKKSMIKNSTREIRPRTKKQTKKEKKGKDYRDRNSTLDLNPAFESVAKEGLNEGRKVTKKKPDDDDKQETPDDEEREPTENYDREDEKVAEPPAKSRGRPKKRAVQDEAKDENEKNEEGKDNERQATLNPNDEKSIKAAKKNTEDEPKDESEEDQKGENKKDDELQPAENSDGAFEEEEIIKQPTKRRNKKNTKKNAKKKIQEKEDSKEDEDIECQATEYSDGDDDVYEENIAGTPTKRSGKKNTEKAATKNTEDKPKDDRDGDRQVVVNSDCGNEEDEDITKRPAKRPRRGQKNTKRVSEKKGGDEPKEDKKEDEKGENIKDGDGEHVITENSDSDEEITTKELNKRPRRGQDKNAKKVGRKKTQDKPKDENEEGGNPNSSDDEEEDTPGRPCKRIRRSQKNNTRKTKTKKKKPKSMSNSRKGGAAARPQRRSTRKRNKKEKEEEEEEEEEEGSVSEDGDDSSVGDPHDDGDRKGDIIKSVIASVSIHPKEGHDEFGDDWRCSGAIDY